MEEAPRESLSDRISGLLAALRKSKSSQAESSSTAASNSTSTGVTNATAYDKNASSNVQVKSSNFVVETLPDLLEFLKSTSKPKLLREVVARFLENPLLSENDRDLVKKKVREKIEEEKKKKEARKTAAVTDSPGHSDTSSRAQELVQDSNNLTPTAPSDTGTRERNGQITIKLNTSNPLIGALLDRKVETSAELHTEADNGSRQNKWVTSSNVPSDPSAPLGIAELPVSAQVSLNGAPIQNSLLLPDNAFSAPPPAINPYMLLPQQIPQMAGVYSVPPATFQVPPPNVLAVNHGAAGFVSYGNNAVNASTVYLTRAAVDYEKDMIPRTPTPPPTPPPVINPRLRAGAMVPALSASGRLIMPGARLPKRSQSPIEADAAEKESVEENKKEKRRRKDRKGTEREADMLPKVPLLNTLSSENVGKKCYIRQYAVRHGVTYEEAKKILQEEECNFLSSKFRQNKKRRRSRSRGRCSRSIEKEEDDNRVYTKGFAPLPKQKYAKNFEETDFAEDMICEETFSGSKDDVYGHPNGVVEGGRTREEGYYDEKTYYNLSYHEEAAGAPKSNELARYCDEDYCSYSHDAPERRRRRRGGKRH